MQFVMDNKNRNYTFFISILVINCMLCLCLSSQIWNETYVCIFIVKL
jgi:hypothetical protein